MSDLIELAECLAPRQMPPVHSKPNFYRRFRANEFGNRSELWSSPEDCLASGYTGLISVRTSVPGGSCVYDVPVENLPVLWADFLCIGYKPEQLSIAMAMPAKDVIFSGEVSYTHHGLHLLYSFLRDHHRPAMRVAKHAWGLQAKALIASHCNQASAAWLQYLLDHYDEHAIEFSVLPYCWGTVPGHNTLFWEVRQY